MYANVSRPMTKIANQQKDEGLADQADEEQPKLIKELAGHSGCAVLLYHGSSGYFVRKFSPNTDYNERLKRQTEKQKDFFRKGFSCPAVLREGYEKGLFFFDMDYIFGLDIISILEESTTKSLGNLADALTQSLEKLSETVDDHLPSHLFLGKIDDILGFEPGFSCPDELLQAKKQVGTCLGRMNWKDIPRSWSHGDMTLENLIQKRNGALYFIDFLDGELSSFWLDIAKLHQDMISFWFLRNMHGEPEVSARLENLEVLVRRLAEFMLTRIKSKWPEALDRLPNLLAFQLFRIVPYCRSVETLEYTIHRIEQLEITEA